MPQLEWYREERTGAYVAEGVEEDSGERVELVIQKGGGLSRPWILRAAGGIVGASKTLKEAKYLGELYCERGLNTEREV